MQFTLLARAAALLLEHILALQAKLVVLAAVVVDILRYQTIWLARLQRFHPFQLARVERVEALLL
jgi:hypothetical protein